MKIQWQLVKSYDEAKDFFQVVYLHEWHGRPFYWGKVDESVFGGTPRNLGGRRRNGRYNPGYKHWIEGCLRHGARLYIGQLEDEGNFTLDQIEDFLIAKYPSEMNARVGVPIPIMEVNHDGDVPLSILGAARPS